MPRSPSESVLRLPGGQLVTGHTRSLARVPALRARPECDDAAVIDAGMTDVCVRRRPPTLGYAAFRVPPGLGQLELLLFG
jgi:hypothetical protein